MKKNIVIFIIFLSLIIITTYPLVFNITTSIPGFFSTDESYSILWNAWFNRFSLIHDFSIKNTDLISYPFGISFYAKNIISYLWFFINYLLSILTTLVLTYNLQVILNFFLNALFMYLLVFYLTDNYLAGVSSAIIFSFCPYIFVRSWQHLGETYLWMIPMTLWTLFLLRFNCSNKVRALSIAGFVFTTINFNAVQYIIVIIPVFFVYLSVHYLTGKIQLINKIYLVQERRHLKNALLVSLLAFFIVLPQFYPIVKNTLLAKKIAPSAYNLYYRPFEDLFTQSSRPLSYLLPAVVHPIFGKFTEQFIGSPLYGISFTEHTLYLGWTSLILAFIAFKRWRKIRKQVDNLGTVPFEDSPCNRENFYIGFFIFLAIVAWLFSQPPWWNIFGFKIYMPSFFMYKILPMFRAYCRFGIVVMLAVAVLAGFGLKFILEKLKSQRMKIVVTCLFSGLVLFEFWNYPPFKVIDVSRVPAVYYWLKEQPENFVIAEYPLDIVGPNEMYKLYQTKHEKKIINGTIPGTYANQVAQTIKKLSEPKTAGRLKGMGVRYALVHRQDYIETGLVDDREELNKIPQNSGLKFIKTFPAQECPRKDIMCVQKTGPIDVYEVVAKSVEPRVEEKEVCK